MNTLLSVFVLGCALYLRLRYRPTGAQAAQLFTITVLSGIIAGLTITGMSDALSVLACIADVALCLAILFVYRIEIQRQLKKKARRRAAARAAMREYDAILAADAAKRPLTCFAAFTERDPACDCNANIAA